MLNCPECPYQDQSRIYGEGSRYKEGGYAPIEVPREERDNIGDYEIVVVGMAPAREELKTKRVLVGVSGQIARGIFDQLGFKDYYLCNVLLCQMTDEDPQNIAVECCRSRLIPEILSHHPKLVVVLGDLPLKELTEEGFEYSVSECMGRIIPSKVGPLLPLVHPAYYYRRPTDFFDYVEAHRPAKAFLEGIYEQAVVPTFEVVNWETIGKAKREMEAVGRYSCDTETTGLRPYGWVPSKILEMGIAASKTHAYIVPPELIDEFQDVLEKIPGEYHNAQFDSSMIRQNSPKRIKVNIGWDSFLGHYSMDERNYANGLKRVAGLYLGCPDWGQDIDQYLPKDKAVLEEVGYSPVPEELRHKYLAMDVTRTFQLRGILEPFINRKVYDKLLMPGQKMFIEIADRGMLIDPMLLMKTDEILEEEIEKAENLVHELTGEWINPNSPQQVKQLVYETLGYPIDDFLGPTTSKEALQPLAETDAIIEAILDYRQLSKSKNGYVENFAKYTDRNFRVHPSINLAASVTGRLSSSNPSIMNIKNDSRLKSLFIADPGSYLGYLDIKQNELRWYCIISGDKVLTKMLREGQDPHHKVATAAYGEEKAEELRTQAKAVVFGRLYKRSRKSIEKQVGSEVIDDLMRIVDSLFPGVGKYSDDTISALQRQGYLESYFGRKRRFGLLTRDYLKVIDKQAINFPIQSAGSDLMLLCLLHLWEIKDELGIWPFWPVHDSITMLMPDPGVLPKVKKEIERFSLEVVNGVMPFVWDPKIGLNWGELKKPSEFGIKF